MNEVLRELGVVWILLVAPGYTDYEVEVLAKAASIHDTIKLCEDEVKRYAATPKTADLHTWCEPYGGYTR